MKSDMAHMTAVSISSHRNPRCILRERRLASEGCQGGDGLGFQQQILKFYANPGCLAASDCMRAWCELVKAKRAVGIVVYDSLTRQHGPQLTAHTGQKTRKPLR